MEWSDPLQAEEITGFTSKLAIVKKLFGIQYHSWLYAFSFPRGWGWVSPIVAQDS